MRRTALAGLAALALHAALVLVLTWPLALHLTTHLPDPTAFARSDVQYIAWALAHESHALLTAPGHFFDGNIFHPTPRVLLYGDVAFGALPYFFPTFALTGNPTLAINLVFLAGVVLTATALHLVVRHWTGSDVAGLVGAWTYLLHPWTLWRFLPWAPNYALLHYLPVIVLLAAAPARRAGEALRLVPLVVLQGVCNLVYIAPAVLAPLGLLTLGRLARRATRRAGLRLLGALGLAVLALIPFYAGPVAVRLANPSLGEQTFWGPPPAALRETFRDYLVPVGRTYYGPLPLPSGLAAGAGRAASAAYTTVALLVLGGLCAARRRANDPAARAAWLHGALWAGVGLAISAPVVTVLGSAPIRVPHFALLAKLVPSGLEILRVPERCGLVATVAVALLAGVAFAECARRLHGASGHAARIALAAAVVVLLFLEQWPFVVTSYPVQVMPAADGPLVAALRAGQGPVLELPVSGNFAAFRQARAAYRSIFHWRPLLNGYANYWPPGFPERMILAERLPELQALETLRRETGLTTVVVRLDELDGQQRALWRAFAARGGRHELRLMARDGYLLLFAVRPWVVPRAGSG